MAEAGTEDCLGRCFITVVISGPRSATHRDVGNTNRVGNTIGAVCDQKRRRGAWQTACDPQGVRNTKSYGERMRERTGRTVRDRGLLSADRGRRTSSTYLIATYPNPRPFLSPRRLTSSFPVPLQIPACRS